MRVRSCSAIICFGTTLDPFFLSRYLDFFMICVRHFLLQKYATHYLRLFYIWEIVLCALLGIIRVACVWCFFCDHISARKEQQIFWEDTLMYIVAYKYWYFKLEDRQARVKLCGTCIELYRDVLGGHDIVRRNNKNCCKICTHYNESGIMLQHIISILSIAQQTWVNIGLFRICLPLAVRRVLRAYLT